LSPAFNDFKKLLATPELPALGPGPRLGVSAEEDLVSEMRGLFSSVDIPADRQSLISSLILLWHDHLDSSHSISQKIENPDGSFLHAIMHRREPDFSNAKYWFRRTGAHPAFAEIGRRAQALPSANQHQGLIRLDRDANWDPCAFVDACQKAAGSPSKSAAIDFLRQVQQIESEALLERFLS
jgi:hypothetical protein